MARRSMARERRALAVTVRELRARKRLTQEQVAELAGRSRNFVAEVEGGRRGSSFEGIIAIVQALEVPVEEFGRVFDSRLAETP